MRFGPSAHRDGLNLGYRWLVTLHDGRVVGQALAPCRINETADFDYREKIPMTERIELPKELRDLDEIAAFVRANVPQGATVVVRNRQAEEAIRNATADMDVTIERAGVDLTLTGDVTDTRATAQKLFDALQRKRAAAQGKSGES